MRESIVPSLSRYLLERVVRPFIRVYTEKKRAAYIRTKQKRKIGSARGYLRERVPRATKSNMYICLFRFRPELHHLNEWCVNLTREFFSKRNANFR